jgi:hypothetical protein
MASNALTTAGRFGSSQATEPAGRGQRFPQIVVSAIRVRFKVQGLRDQPPFNDWPCVGEWVRAGSPPVFGLRLLAMRRSHFALRPG